MHSLLLLALVLGSTSAVSIQIAQSFGPLRMEPCAHICMGTTIPGAFWKGGDGELYIDVDMSVCQFIETPIITVSIQVSSKFIKKSSAKLLTLSYVYITFLSIYYM